MKPTITIRVDEAELVEWRRAANLEGRTLSNWVVSRCNAKLTMPAEGKPGAELATKKISEDASPPIEQRTVPRGRGLNKRIEDVTYPAIRKHIPETAGTRAPGSKKAVPTCKHGVERGYHCWQCKGVAVIS